MEELAKPKQKSTATLKAEIAELTKLCNTYKRQLLEHHEAAVKHGARIGELDAEIQRLRNTISAREETIRFKDDVISSLDKKGIALSREVSSFRPFLFGLFFKGNPYGE